MVLLVNSITEPLLWCSCLNSGFETFGLVAFKDGGLGAPPKDALFCFYPLLFVYFAAAGPPTSNSSNLSLTSSIFSRISWCAYKFFTPASSSFVMFNLIPSIYTRLSYPPLAYFSKMTASS
tara:strand:- start:79 stop:441 length:363 start_codon:yes stop_codon:yes gene_type:complete